MSYEFVYLTITYACGCSALRPVRRDAYEQDYPMHAHMDDRNVQADGYCAIRKALALRAHERKMERRVVG